MAHGDHLRAALLRTLDVPMSPVEREMLLDMLGLLLRVGQAERWSGAQARVLLLALVVEESGITAVADDAAAYLAGSG